jgi:uncharacterized phiE125 gp8 family phage protein
MVKALTPTRTVAPAATPISVSEAKTHMGLDHSEHDTRIGVCIDAVTAHLDGTAGILGRALVTQTWKQEWDEFPDGRRIYLPLCPVASVTTVKYYDEDNVQRTLDSSLYGVFTTDWGTFVELKVDEDWPDTYERTDAVEVIFVAGYGVAAAVPAAIRQAMLMMTEDLYRVTSKAGAGVYTNVPTSLTCEFLLAPYMRKWACSPPEE